LRSEKIDSSAKEKAKKARTRERLQKRFLIIRNHLSRRLGARTLSEVEQNSGVERDALKTTPNQEF
jgi:hypothetical protein